MSSAVHHPQKVASGPDPLPHVEIWTDGACKGNPGPGGWGAWMRAGEHTKAIFGGERLTTNNRMELMAVIEALSALKTRSYVVLHTDSQYVKNGITQWLPRWVQRGWRTADNKPVKNDDLWRLLQQASQRHEVHWRWVRGHAGNEGNEKADALANQGAAQAQQQMAKEA